MSTQLTHPCSIRCAPFGPQYRQGCFAGLTSTKLFGAKPTPCTYILRVNGQGTDGRSRRQPRLVPPPPILVHPVPNGNYVLGENKY